MRPQKSAARSRENSIRQPRADVRRKRGKSVAQRAVVCISCETGHHYGALLDSHYRLRYRTFIEQHYWGGVSSFRGREYDKYDNPAAHYLVRLSPDGDAWGCLRLSPTDCPYMLKDNWPEMCADDLPESRSVWEMTRLCVDQSLPAETRRRVKHELVCGLLEFALGNDIRQLIAVMHPKLWRSVFVEAGWRVEFLGEEMTLDDGVARAGMLRISVPLLGRIRKALQIHYPALRLN